MWAEETAHQKFWRRLQDDRLASMMGDPEYLRTLRYKPEVVARTQKHLRPALERRKTTLYKLIAKAHGEVWDAEDEEKSRYAAERDAKKEAAIKQRDNDDLVATREEGACSGLDQLQGKHEESQRELEEGIEELGKKGRQSRPQEEGPPQEEEGARGGGRGGAFYRAAGGTR